MFCVYGAMLLKALRNVFNIVRLILAWIYYGKHNATYKVTNYTLCSKLTSKHLAQTSIKFY